MCGRYYRKSDKEKIAEAFQLGKLRDGFVLFPDYNVAPATFQPVIRHNKETGNRELVSMRWGLIPHYAKDLSTYKGYSTINARAESVPGRGMWRLPFKRYRCVVPADGFYEWKRSQKSRTPFAIGMQNGEPLAFAGLWSAWKQSNGCWLQSYSIITTKANELMGPIHNRMPVILHSEDCEEWLIGGDGETLPGHLLRPYPAEGMVAKEAHTDIGNIRNNHAELLNGA